MIQNCSDWLAGTWLSQLFANTSWCVPTVQTVHILCIGVVLLVTVGRHSGDRALDRFRLRCS